ncbi:MAG: hypothetical protein KKD75_04770 [Nanoarchaeota archaeon]|nr:hypothetical protein [Nanoarchaeota archaeon]MBU1632643.1 hypothetical protein [Nanoarchaeota archaeon]
MRTKINSVKKVELTDEQELISSKNKYFSHLLKHQKKYLVSLLVLIFIFQTALNFIKNKPLMIGGESYYYLSISQNMGFQYNPLTLLLSTIPKQIIFLIPPIIAIFCILILFDLAKKMNLSDSFTFFFTLFLIISPTFIYTTITLSTYSVFFLLMLLGFSLLFQENKKVQALSIIPFIIATFFDTLSTIILLFLQSTYIFVNRKKDSVNLAILCITVFLFIFNKFFIEIPLIAGPFHVEKIMRDLISDLGGLNGIGLFTLLLALIGLAIIWKKKNFYLAYLLLPIIVPAYFFNTDTIFFLTLLTLFFATAGFIRLFERCWTLITLKKFTFILLILGILFSTLTFVDRLSEYAPLNADEEALTWIKENTPKESIVLSAPENGYFITYFAERKSLFNLNDKDYKTKMNLSKNIFSSVYIKDLFPLLEQNNISIIYITENMKKNLPKEQGFVFLLKNERFKLIYSYENTEVWVFEKE